MSGLRRDDLIELGVSVPTSFLTEWASGQIARLARRGVRAEELAEIHGLLGAVRKGEPGESRGLLPRTAELAERIRAEALGYEREARAAFSAEPDFLARFRGGVRTGLLVMDLVRELEATLGHLRGHADAAFIARGELLLGRLREVKSRMDAACRDFPPDMLRQCHDKGLLYDRTRRLARRGRAYGR